MSQDDGESDGGSKHPSISADGRFIVFESDATNLGAIDHNDQRDVYLRDRDANGNQIFDEHGTTSTVIVSLSNGAGRQANGGSFDPGVSKNGRHVVFVSNASNLVIGDTNNRMDVFVRDVVAGTTVRMSLAWDGSQANNSSFLPKISGNSRHVVFESTASNLVPGDTNGSSDVFVHDRDPDGNGIFDEGNGTTHLLSGSTAGGVGDGSSTKPSITTRGRFVVFESTSTDLVQGDTNGYYDVFVFDRDPDRDDIFDEGNGVMMLVSRGPGGVLGNGHSRRPGLSANGSQIVFESDADNLGPTDSNNQRDIYARDRDPDGNLIFDGNGVNVMVNLSNSGVQADKPTAYGKISGDGRFVSYVSFSNLLVSTDVNFTFDVFARDRDPDRNGIFDEGNSETILISATVDGLSGNGLSGAGELSSFGRYKVFVSDASNLAEEEDENGLRDIYVRRIY